MLVDGCNFCSVNCMSIQSNVFQFCDPTSCALFFEKGKLFTWWCSYIISVMYMPLSSKFLPEYTAEKTVNISQYLAKIWKKYNSLLFSPPWWV